MNSLEIKNKKAYFDYFIEKEIEVGIVLEGREVKAIRNSRCNLKGSWCDIINGEMFVKGMHISNYQEGKENFLIKSDPYRERKLLLHKGEILRLYQLKQLENITFVPLKVYLSQGKVKLLLGVCKGKKKYDKRESIKEREINRSLSKGQDM